MKKISMILFTTFLLPSLSYAMHNSDEGNGPKRYYVRISRTEIPDTSNHREEYTNYDKYDKEDGLRGGRIVTFKSPSKYDEEAELREGSIVTFKSPTKVEKVDEKQSTNFVNEIYGDQNNSVEQLGKNTIKKYYITTNYEQKDTYTTEKHPSHYWLTNIGNEVVPKNYDTIEVSEVTERITSPNKDIKEIHTKKIVLHRK